MLGKRENAEDERTHDLFRRQDTKLNFFHFAERSSRMGELMAQHGCETGEIKTKRATQLGRRLKTPK